jgi:uncharacterized phage protein (TIGR02220 family)
MADYHTDNQVFLVYKDWETLFDSLDSNEEAGELIKALFAFAKRGEIAEFSGALKMAFIIMSRQLDKDGIKWEQKCEKNAINGAKGGRPKNKTDFEETEKSERFFEKPKKADKDKDKDKEEDKDIRYIVEYLNQKAGTNYRDSSANTKRHIHARISDGFTVDDFKTVIDKKCGQWIGDSKMQKFLRPETLFGRKFEGYLNEQVTAKQEEVNPYAGIDSELIF